MNDEIKEILEQLEWYKKIGEKDIMFPEHLLTNKKVFLLLDYITNLQQELQEANESITWWTNRFKAVEEENRKIKDLCDKYEKEHNTTFKECQKDIQANKRTIEYIKSGKTFDNEDVKKVVDKIQNDLLEILEEK